MPACERARRDARRFARWLLPVCVLGARSVFAGVDFEPRVSFGVSHTDNLTLAADDKESQTVYQLTPSFRFGQESPRVSSNAAYRIEAYDFRERHDSSVFNRVDGNVRVALDPNNFFFDLGASRDQTIVDPEAPIPQSNLPISTNRINRDQGYWGPTFQYSLGANATATGSFRRSIIRYHALDSGVGDYARDFDQDVLAFGFNNYRRQSGFTWAMRYSADRTNYDLFPAYEYRQASVELGSWAGRGVRVFATGGKESPWDMPFDSALEDTFWEIGLSTQQEKRFHVDLATGERSYGRSKRASLDFAFAHGSMQVTYAEQPTTQGRDPYLGGLLSADAGRDFLTRINSAERFLSKQWRWTMGFNLRRTDFSLSAFDETRADRFRLDGTPLDDESQNGRSLSASLHAGSRTDFVLNLWSVHREFIGTISRTVVDAKAASFRVNYGLGRQTTVSLEYKHSEEDSEENTLRPGYAANEVSVLLTRTFLAGR